MMGPNDGGWGKDKDDNRCLHFSNVAKRREKDLAIKNEQRRE